MPKVITAYRVFIASPSGLEKERTAFRDAIGEQNDADAVERGVLFLPMGWEDTPGGRGRPQEIINEEVKRCDYFVLVLHEWWGSRPQVGAGFSSGTDEELNVARKCMEAGSMQEIIIFFKDIDRDKLRDPGDQLKAVLKFREDLEANKEFLFETFDQTGAFQGKLRKHLAKWVREHERGLGGAPPAAQPRAPAAPVSLRQPALDVGSESGSATLSNAARLAQQGHVVRAEQALAGVIGGAQGGDVSTEQLEAMVQFGGMLMLRESYEGAEDIFRKLQLSAQAAQSEEWEVAALNNLARVHIAMKQLDKAEAEYRAALQIREKSLGPDDPGIVDSLNRLAEFLANHRFNYVEAKQLLGRALAIQGIQIAV